MLTSPPMLRPGNSGENGSAPVAVLSVLALLGLLLVTLIQSIRIERSTSTTCIAEEQAHLATESGVSSACALLMLATSNRPAYLVGFPEYKTSANVAPPLAIGASNLNSSSQIIPLFSFNLRIAASFPQFSKEVLNSLLEKRLSTNPSTAVDLNAASLISNSAKTNSPEDAQGGMVAATGCYPALWQYLHDDDGKLVGRYAFILTDESARLNPLLHHGHPRNSATDWDSGAGDIPLTNGSSSLFTTNQSERLQQIATLLPTTGSLKKAFDNSSDYSSKRDLLTRYICNVPDLIPAVLPEGGLPKYNLNDLVTNPAWGKTPYDRALKIASVIDKNLPKFKRRDTSLSSRGSDQMLYLQRLACSIVDYISAEQGPTGPPGGEPAGRDLVPYVTQIAERCTRTGLTSNSVTIESQFFVELWNPTTSTIKSGGNARFLISNRARLNFGTGISEPFSDYDATVIELPEFRPNEFIVVNFGPKSQTWTSPTTTSNPPCWGNGPTGNATDQPQFFDFFWNGRLVDFTRRPPISPGTVSGGLCHYGQTLDDATPRWQCLSVPTWSASSAGQQDVSAEAIQTGNYRFVGDPRANFLTAYTWGVTTNYSGMTLWNGVSPARIFSGAFLMDPRNTWTRRDRVPENPPTGISPSSSEQNPDQIPSPYRADHDGKTAPFVIRKGAMESLAELGNIFDPAQVDDAGEAPTVAFPKSRLGCGGGRTLRIGQPEFDFSGPVNWDVPGKRAVELLDVFTIADAGRRPDPKLNGKEPGIPGRINVNTASHPVLAALFSGIGVDSDRRYSNCVISPESADALATVIEKHRPYNRLSDLSVLTTNLANAETFTPRLSTNVPDSSPPVADVFDRAREEAFGKFIGHCVLQTRAFHIYVVGESLDRRGRTAERSIMEGIIDLTPDNTGRLLPSLHDVQWH